MLYESVLLSDAVKHAAWADAKEMLDNGMFSRFGLSDKKRREKAYVGRLGELAFQMLLEDNGIPFEPGTYDPQRHSDNGDVLVNGYVIDVKTARTFKEASPSWIFGYPLQQHPEEKDGIVIANLANQDSEIRFFGIISGENVARCPLSSSNSYSGEDYMTENYEISYGNLDPEVLSYIWEVFLDENYS